MGALNRRTLFGASVAISAAVSLPASAKPITGYAEALRELQALRATEVRLNAGKYDDPEWAVWERRHNRFLDAAEALPNTPENARIKALAFKAIYKDDDFGDFLGDQNTTDHRLALQIIQSLLEVH